jgi:hypothetical protein
VAAESEQGSHLQQHRDQTLVVLYSEVGQEQTEELAWKGNMMSLQKTFGIASKARKERGWRMVMKRKQCNNEFCKRHADDVVLQTEATVLIILTQILNVLTKNKLNNLIKKQTNKCIHHTYMHMTHMHAYLRYHT